MDDNKEKDKSQEAINDSFQMLKKLTHKRVQCCRKAAKYYDKTLALERNTLEKASYSIEKKDLVSYSKYKTKEDLEKLFPDIEPMESIISKSKKIKAKIAELNEEVVKVRMISDRFKKKSKVERGNKTMSISMMEESIARQELKSDP